MIWHLRIQLLHYALIEQRQRFFGRFFVCVFNSTLWREKQTKHFVYALTEYFKGLYPPWCGVIYSPSLLFCCRCRFFFSHFERWLCSCTALSVRSRLKWVRRSKKAERWSSKETIERQRKRIKAGWKISFLHAWEQWIIRFKEILWKNNKQKKGTEKREKKSLNKNGRIFFSFIIFSERLH